MAWDDDVRVTCSFGSISRPVINRETFEVTFAALTVNITYPTHKFLGFALPNQINANVVDSAKEALTQTFSALKIQLSAMSMFAASNLLFPESRVIEPEGVYFPHDMVIVGRVPERWSRPEEAAPGA